MAPQLSHLIDSHFSASKFTVQERLLNFYTFGDVHHCTFGDGDRLTEFIIDKDFRRVAKVEKHIVYISILLLWDGTVRVEGFSDSRRLMCVVQILAVGLSGLTKREITKIPTGFLKNALNIGFHEEFYTDAESIVRFIQYMAYEFV